VGRDIPLGRIAGIRVGMSLTVPIIGLVYAVTLAENRFPILVPGQTSTSYWVAGILGALMFFVSLLAHEVGHALVARREGIGVEGISLWLLGGVAKLEHEADNAGAELRIAAIGPLTSFAVGVVFWFFHEAVSGGTGLTELYVELFGWLAFINVILAAFNLLPGSPLDGGRVLSALLWMQTRDQTAAQNAAARFGQVLGGCMTALGVFLLMGGSGANGNGILVIFVGGYILMSATTELRATASMGLLRGVRLSEVMDVDPPVLPAWMTVHDLVATAPRFHPHTAFPIRDINGRISGLLTAEAVQATDPRTWPTLRLGDLAFPIDRVQTARTDESVLVTVQRTRNSATGRVLVVHPDGRVAGVVGNDVADRAMHIQQARQGQTVAA
jgi:Zn-dependent protease